MIYLVKPMFSVNDFRKISIIIYVINAFFKTTVQMQIIYHLKIVVP